MYDTPMITERDRNTEGTGDWKLATGKELGKGSPQPKESEEVMQGEHSKAISPEKGVNAFESKKEIKNCITDIRTKMD